MRVGDAGAGASALAAPPWADIGGNPLRRRRGPRRPRVAPPPPPPAGAPSPTTGVLTKLKSLNLWDTQITDAGCATLASALLDSGTLPALEDLDSYVTTRASAAARAAVTLSLKLARARAGVPSYLLR